MKSNLQQHLPIFWKTQKCKMIDGRMTYKYYYIEYYGTDVIHSFKSLLESHNISPDKNYAICKQN